MNSVGDAFGFAFRDPAWFGKIVVQGLIGIIPIIGWIAAFGWMLMTLDNMRAGRQELPPAGFHLSRGIGLFGVYVLYAIVLNIPGWILQLAGGGGLHQVCNSDNVCSYNYAAAGPIAALGSLLGFVASLFLYFLLPSLIVMVYHHGFAGGFAFGQVWASATANIGNSVIGGLIIWVAGLIGGLGILVCCVGLLFTIPYSITIQAGVAAWFERMQAAPAAPAAPAA